MPTTPIARCNSSTDASWTRARSSTCRSAAQPRAEGLPMRALLDELKAAMTGLARTPAFTALAAGVLGLGLGAVIFMYGVADTLMLKPVPYPNSDRLYAIATIGSLEADRYSDSMKPMDYQKVREAQTQFEAIGSIY